MQTFDKLAREKGDFTEREVINALYALRDEYNAPILLTSSKKLDYQGVDIEIKGTGNLHLWIGLDAKSSKAGVEAYRKKQEELVKKGVRNAFPRYPFVYDRFNESRPQLMLDLLRFIVKKSRTHSEYIDLVPEGAEDMGFDFDTKDVTEFSHKLRDLIHYLFEELDPVFN
ncbi:MAG: hypothetical protein WDZ40_04065 [Candidatus Spechtbacterales bacterium]